MASRPTSLGALSPHCSPSAATPAPAANQPLPNPRAPSSPTTLSPDAPPSLPSGRSKTQRWIDSSPPSSSVEASPTTCRTFRDVLLSQPLMAVPAPKPVTEMAAPAPLAGADSRQGDEGWQLVQRKCSQRHPPPQARHPPRRAVPEDLRGRCFNCLSFQHRAASCRSRTRCLRSFELGHLSYGSPRWLAALRPTRRRVPPPRNLTWWSVPALAPTPVAPPSADHGGRQRHFRCWRSSSREPSPTQPPSDAEDQWPVVEMRSSSSTGDVPLPVCVVHRTESFNLAEADLRQALFVAIGGNRPTLAPQQVIDVVARSFSIDPEALRVAVAALEDFLLFLSDSAMADRVFNGGAPLQGAGFSLFFKRWTRLANAEAVTLPVATDVELRGIPAHAWEWSTAQHILGGSCWVHSLHADTVARRDLLVFLASAWCLWPDLLPTAMKLLIPAPALTEAESPPMKRGLLYPVQVSLAAAGAPPPPLASAAGPGAAAPLAPVSPLSVISPPSLRTGAFQPWALRHAYRFMQDWAPHHASRPAPLPRSSAARFHARLQPAARN
jgi:hypothetical protein